MLRLILHSLRQTLGSSILLAIPILLASLSMVVLCSVYLASRSIGLQGVSGLEANEIIATPSRDSAESILHPLQPSSLTEKDIQTIRSIPGVTTVQARHILRSPVSVRLSVLGQTLESDTPLYGIEGEIPGADGGFSGGQPTIPVLLSRSFVTLMGSTLSDMLGIPRLRADLLVGHDITILSGYSSFFPSERKEVRQWPARIISLSERVPFVGLSIPMADLQRIADASGTHTAVSDVLLTLSSAADLPSVRRTLESRGFTTDSLSQRLGLIQDRLRSLLFILTGIGLILLVFVITTVLAIVWSDVQLHTRQIGIMRSFGAAAGQVRMFFLGKVAVIAGVSAVIGAVGGQTLITIARSRLSPDVPIDSLGMPTQLTATGLGILLILSISLLSALPPILRANRLSPVRALGEEA